MKKTRVFWGTPERDVVGNGYGYSFHNKMMVKHTAPFIENDPEAKMVLQIISADLFQPVLGRVNILFSMWEFIDVPPSYQKALAAADYVIVPSRFCRDIFAPYCKRRPYVCQEGVDPADYPYVERKVGNKFRFLWVGAPNPRKGYQSILQVLQLADKFPQLEFYLKTTVKKTTLGDFLRNTVKNWKQISEVEEGKGWSAWWRILRRLPSPWNANKVFKYGKNKNVIVDTRKLPMADLQKLYHDSHAFLFPTLGEGWGLTLTEAMATGLPCIAPPITGCADYFDDNVGFTIKSAIKPIPVDPKYGIKEVRAYLPCTQHLLDRMIEVANNYDRALVKGKAASERIRTKFTWERSGKRLGDILDEIAINEGLK